MPISHYGDETELWDRYSSQLNQHNRCTAQQEYRKAFQLLPNGRRRRRVRQQSNAQRNLDLSVSLCKARKSTINFDRCSECMTIVCNAVVK